jgi:hypothetical protein
MSENIITLIIIPIEFEPKPELDDPSDESKSVLEPLEEPVIPEDDSPLDIIIDIRSLNSLVNEEELLEDFDELFVVPRSEYKFERGLIELLPIVMPL